jgi:hypothetical protein
VVSRAIRGLTRHWRTGAWISLVRLLREQSLTPFFLAATVYPHCQTAGKCHWTLDLCLEKSPGGARRILESDEPHFPAIRSQRRQRSLSAPQVPAPSLPRLREVITMTDADSAGAPLGRTRGTPCVWSSIMLVLPMLPFWGADNSPVGCRNLQTPAACIAAFRRA